MNLQPRLPARVRLGMPTFRTIVALIPLLFCSIACASRAYDTGVAEAQADLKADYAYLYTYGERRAVGHDYNEETGLPYKAIAGCIIDDDITDRARGYNETVKAWIKQQGREPSNSIKPYAEQLKDLGTYWAESKASAVAVELKPVKVDDTHTVMLNPVDERGYSTLVLKTDTGDATHFLAVDPIKNVQFKPGPAGSRTIVVRFENADNSVCYVVLETRRGARLIVQTVHE
jgi:hypothetical protein